MSTRRYDAVLFDLLTALLDSWTLWNAVAGDDDLGRRWRAEYLRITYRTGGYRPYEALVAEAAEAVGLPRTAAGQLDERYGELKPWPGVPQALRALAAASVPLGIVTNCSERLGRIAAGCVGVDVAVLVTAERAGFYKPDPRTYRLGLREIGVAAPRCLFVAGSPYDLVGTGAAGLPTYWHDRSGMTAPPDAPAPLARATNLDGLPAFVLG
ncbi:haloacid dehalogenase [Methylobacterium terrae]|uniref:Haloacid dehalogenase n=1 Tax=Methylobacterium terrae TaxID=2202827 RepID=A0A2U8WMT1_9HYPH|nr:HAD-IA family hydrolase [Methylobacterium terrae]AWN47403.1 haloacid dehalogenase [Methylobacterium terrae]